MKQFHAIIVPNHNDDVPNLVCNQIMESSVYAFSEDEFLIIACDGLFDFVTAADAAVTVRVALRRLGKKQRQNQDPCRIWAFQDWDIIGLGHCGIGTLWDWDIMGLGHCRIGTLYPRNQSMLSIDNPIQCSLCFLLLSDFSTGSPSVAAQQLVELALINHSDGQFNVEGFRGFKVWGFRGFKVYGFIGFKVWGFVGFQVYGFQGFTLIIHIVR